MTATQRLADAVVPVGDADGAILLWLHTLLLFVLDSALNVLLIGSLFWLGYALYAALSPFVRGRGRGKVERIYGTTYGEVMRDVRRGDMEEVDVIVVGGGVAGCGIARGLGASGRRVLVLERDLTEPNRIVGELMQPGGLQALDRLGMLDCVEGIDSQSTKGYAIYQADGTRLLLDFPERPDGSRYAARTFHHGRFIQNLRASAAAVNGVELRTATVLRVIEEKGCVVGVEYKVNGEVRSVYAPTTFLCDGCFSRFRKTMSKSQPTTDSYFVGVVVEDALPSPGYGNVFLTNPTPVLAYPIGTGEVRMLIDIPAPLPSGEELKQYILTKIAPQLDPALAQKLREAIDRDGLRSMPNLKLHPAPIRKAGCVLIGDSWNCRHPLTGGGMTVALSDAATLAEALHMADDLGDYDAVEHIIRRVFFPIRTPYAAAVNILAYALYKVFSADPTRSDAAAREELRSACFSYLRLGGRASHGPMLLLSGLHSDKSPSFLIRYFFEVAFFGVGKILFPPTPARLYTAFKVLWIAVEIIAPLMWNELFVSMDAAP